MDKKPRLIEVPICLDATLEDTVAAAKIALDHTAHQLLESFTARVRQQQALHSGIPADDVAAQVAAADEADLEALKAQVDHANQALTDGCQVYSFRPLGWKAWKALKAAYPSKDKDLLFDVDAMTPTILRDASHEPKMSAAVVEDMLNDPAWSAGEIEMLVNAAIRVQV